MVSAGRLLLAAPLSLTGRYAFQGGLAAAGLRRVVSDVWNSGGVVVGGDRLLPEVVIGDDASTRDGVRKALEELARADILIGPYGSDLVAEAARWAAERGRVVFNHGGSADDVQRLPGVVSVPSPASRYLAAVLEAVAGGLPGARVLVAAGRGSFGRSAAGGAREAAERLGMKIVAALPHDEVPPAPDTDVLLAAGSFAEDVALIGRLSARPPVVGAVAAGLGIFGAEFPRLAEGVLAPSQWEEGARFRPDVGPRQVEVIRALRAEAVATLRAETAGAHVDYPVAQPYAAGLVALRCIEEAGTLADAALLEAARRLSITTFFGRFRLGDDGRQEGHEMLVVQWQQGVKRIVWPSAQAEVPLSM